MKIVFIGAGNVATHLASAMDSTGFEIIQIFSQTIESAKALSEKLSKKPIYTNQIDQIDNRADLYIFSIKDSALQQVVSQIKPNSGIWIHTAGSMSIDLFRGYANRFGVIYPLQTFSKNKQVDWTNIPIFLEASDIDTLDVLKSVAGQLSKSVYELSSDKRKYVHLTGVFACNFTNYMYSASADILQQAGLPFEVALPLIDETCAKVHTLSPKEAQTGPAIRFDENVMNRHIDLIEDAKLKEIYRLISEKIHENHLKK
ncbi:Rossmann-like and DUF2520 domain-containing protein [Dysgonomonas massiliensis]|uniref:Rossmann-like and DUF2520 domain-containing protein n=1 Tax=Dysgonomonas massiliensis TaxID=2040292 RepID=UPI000C760928|nr:Rossmann-like and DUF2520 domain-containing protein [Dysgonomonas massiliensis]